MRRKLLKKYFIPHAENEYRPHIFREASVLIIASLALLIFVASHSPILYNQEFRATVLPAVLVDQANEVRVKQQARTLSINPLLVAAAQNKANDMAQKSYFSHVSPDGTTPWDWMKGVSYKFVYAGENLAIGFFESEEVTQAWLNSPSHRDNLLNNNFTEIGIAIAKGLYQGVETTFVVQMFGTPAPTAIAQTPQRELETESASVPPSLAEVPSAQVGGAETEVPNSEGEILDLVQEGLDRYAPIAQSEQFIVIQELVQVDAPIDTSASGATLERKYSSRFLHALAEPKNTANYIYLLLAGVILISLIISIFYEVGQQHPRHVFQGVLILFLLVGLAYINQATIFSDILVV